MLRFEELPKVNSERWLSLDNIEGEEWRDVVGFEDRFAISNYGRMKRKPFQIYNSKTDSYTSRGEMILKMSKNLKGYYMSRTKMKDRKLYKSYHRIVAEAFIKNPDNLPVVNHKDENKENNCVYNLEWCTYQYNTNYGTNKERSLKTKRERGLYQAVVAYTYDGEVIEEFYSAKEAAKKYGILETGIIRCCRNKRNAIRGYHFRFKNEEYQKREIVKDSYSITLYRNNTTDKFNSIRQLGEALGISPSVIFGLIRRKRKHSNQLENTYIEITSTKGDYKIKNGVLIYIYKKE